MDDGVDPMLVDRSAEDLDGAGARQIKVDQRRLIDPGCLAGAEIIQNDNLVTAVPQQPDDMATDVAGTTCDKDGHPGSLVRLVWGSVPCFGKAGPDELAGHGEHQSVPDLSGLEIQPCAAALHIERQPEVVMHPVSVLGVGLRSPRTFRRASPRGRHVDRSELRKLAALEETHWWYRERRHLLARQVRAMPPGRALDIGAAAGGNTRVLIDRGWDAIALEYSEEGARIAGARGVPVVRADALTLPFPDTCLDLVVAYDVLEHIRDDDRAVQEFFRVLRPGATALVAVPADPQLWSAHDEAVGHVRRYTRSSLVPLLERNGLHVAAVESWNVLLRPVVAWHRRTSTGSDQEQMSPVLNLGLRAVVATERYLPVKSLPGVSLLVRAQRR